MQEYLPFLLLVLRFFVVFAPAFALTKLIFLSKIFL